MSRKSTYTTSESTHASDADLYDGNIAEETTEATVTPAKPATPVEDPEDVERFLNEIEAAVADIRPQELRFKAGFDTSKWHFIKLRPDQMERDRGMLTARKIVLVTRDGAILGFPFSEMFEPEQFDEDDNCVSFGKHPGTKKKELYLHCQPIGAYRAVLQLRDKAVYEYQNPRTSQKLKESAEKIERTVSGSGRVISSVMGEESPDGWE